jgi:hypothetical protein
VEKLDALYRFHFEMKNSGTMRKRLNRPVGEKSVDIHFVPKNAS